MWSKLKQLFGRRERMIGVFKTSPDGRYLYANAALAKIYRYPSPEHMVEELRDIQRQLYVDPVRRLQFIFQMGRDGKVENFQSEIYCADRSRIWITENSQCVKDEAGELLHYEGTVELLPTR